MDYNFQLLKILRSNLQKMQALLSYGDGESTLKIISQNERILFLLESVKKKESQDYNLKINDLVNTCIYLQEDCDKKLTAITLEYKKEFNTHLIKRQLKTHLKNT